MRLLLSSPASSALPPPSLSLPSSSSSSSSSLSLFFFSFFLVLLSGCDARSSRPLRLVGAAATATAAASADASSMTSTAVATVTFTLYDNGSSVGGIDVTLAPGEFRESASSHAGADGDDEDDGAPPGEAFALDMSRRIKVRKYMADEPVLATRAFREDGELITTFEQLAPTLEVSEGGDEENGEGEKKRRVYLVAEGLEFVWPFVKLGHRQIVSPNVLLPPKSETAEPVVLESISESPRVFRVHNICSPSESLAIIDNALSLTGEHALHRSTVGEDEKTETRTSENAWDSDSDVAKTLISRSFNLTNIEENSGKRDGLQIVRYKPGQGYNTHPDYFQATRDDDFNFNPYSGGSNRFATVFIYLNDVADDQGGFTVFPSGTSLTPPRDPPPQALEMFKPRSWQMMVTEKCYKALAVPPKLGTAALFYSITPDGRIDPTSHHAACPLIDGTKWGANIWLWNRQRYGEVRTGDARALLISNESDRSVYLTWERKDSGVMDPGDSIHMNTFEFHRFKAHWGGFKGGETIDEYTVESEPMEQRWVIKNPRIITALEDDGPNEEL